MNDPFHVIDLRDHPILVSADIENHPSSLEYARVAVLQLDVGRFLPVRAFDHGNPRFERRPRIRIAFAERVQFGSRYDSHAAQFADPSRDIKASNAHEDNIFVTA